MFIGISTNDYAFLQVKRGGAAIGHRVTGNSGSIAANRISHFFDFRGPSLAIDTACSSSLVATHLACRSLWDGESEVALAGGSNLLLQAQVFAGFAKSGFLSPDGHCRAFDAEANGYVRGEGAGIVVLKPLSRAVADGDPIYAVIRGGAVNQDGRTNGLTAPSRPAQEAVLRAAYRHAGVAPGPGRLRRGARDRHAARRSDRARRPRRRAGRGPRRGPALRRRLGEDQHRPPRGRGRASPG